MKIILVLCVATFQLQESHAECVHAVVAPKGFRLDTLEEIYIDFHDCPRTNRVSIHANLMSLPNRIYTHHEFKSNNISHHQKPVRIQLQAKADRLERKRGRPIYKANLDISYCFGGWASWTKVPTIRILLNATHGYAFMTTDRPAYRPGDTVKISLAVTNQDLTMEQKRRNIHVLIATPNERGRIIVRDKEHFSAQSDGFIDDSYKVPKNPVKGVWWAEAHIDGVKMAEKSFVIDKYELPTFDVKIVPNYHFVLPTHTHIEGCIFAEYSYGKKVDGNYFMSFKLARADGTETEFYRIPTRFDLSATISQGKRCYNVPMENLRKILRNEETLQQLALDKARLIITASVTGYTESVFESDYVDDIIFTQSPFVIDHSASAKFYLPHTAYELKLTVRDVVSGHPLPNIPVRIAWNGEVREDSSDANGDVTCLIDSLRQSRTSEKIVITTNSEDFNNTVQSTSELEVHKYDETRQMAVALAKEVANVDQKQTIIFRIGRHRPRNIRYFVISRGRFVLVGSKILQPGQKREVTDDFTVTSKMVPHARVVAYYILEGNVTSNSAWFDVKNTCQEELEIVPARKSVFPGTSVEIEVKGAPNMAVHIIGVDRAAYFVHNGTRVSRNQLWTKMEEYDTGCSRKGGLNAIHVFEEAGLIFATSHIPPFTFTKMYCEDARDKRSADEVQQSPEAYLVKKMDKCIESAWIGNLYGLECEERTMQLEMNMADRSMPTDLKLNCSMLFKQSCIMLRNSHHPDLMRAATLATKKAKKVREIKRKDFKESWDIPRTILCANGQKTLQSKTKQSITTMELDAFGMSENAPMCVAETKYVTVFKEFFIQLYLPYSVHLREEATIKLSVFYYGGTEEEVDKEIDVYVKHSGELCSRFQSEDFVHLSHLRITPSYDAVSTEFTILPTKIPDNNDRTATITILAQSEVHEDIVEKQLLIEEQGVHNESSGTIVLQPDKNETHLNFDFPDANVIMLPTRKCDIHVYAHPMGPVVEIDEFTKKVNIGEYIRLPRGCGEQNMILVAPVIYIHSYRVSSMRDQVTAVQKNQVLESIQKGYDNQLGHRADSTSDKAFSVYHNTHPSTWLNAFVTKVFSQAREFWPGMNTVPICDALEWMLGMQGTDGKFSENHYVHAGEYLRGLVTEEVTLTSYVIISLEETAGVCPALASRIEYAKRNAIQFVKSRYTEAVQGSYSLAMGTYAIAMSELGSRSSWEARLWNARLRSQRQSEGNYFFWIGSREGAANIETTAYALLAELTLNGITGENDDLTRKIAHWLISKRNANGGFKSTQDTVVAMQALAKYMTILESSVVHAPPPINLNVTIAALESDSNWKEVLNNLTVHNTRQRKTVQVPASVIRGVKVAVTGNGTGSLSYRCTWRQYNNDDNCRFSLSVEVADGDLRNDKILKVTVSKTGTPAQMSIVDVGILSGFEPDEESVKELTSEEVVDYQADRYEITENTVKFYINRITMNATKLAFKIKRKTPIRNGQPAAVSVYDYYEPDITCTKFYTMQGDDYHIKSINCDRDDRGDDEGMCRCAEGDCPLCRTRAQQLNETICSNHNKHQDTTGNNNNKCGPELSLCESVSDDDCFNLHRETCDRDYLYVVEVKEVGTAHEIPEFKYFFALVLEVFRTTEKHLHAANTRVKFLIREDCFNQCKDPRFEYLQRTKNLPEVPLFIREGRLLLVYGSHPMKDQNGQYVYDLSRTGGMELLVHPKKCKRGGERGKICTLRSILKDAHISGCD